MAQDPGCGNGRIEPGEQCDDGNLLAGDGCDSTCQVEQQCLDAGNEFSFFVWSDAYPGQETGVRRVLTDATNRTKYPDRVIPRFWVSTGDIPFMETSPTLLDELNNAISNSATGQNYPFTCNASSGKFPYFVAVGNHDVDGVHSTPQAQYDYWSNTVGPRLPNSLVGISNFRWGPSGAQDARTTYSFDYKNAHFIILNQYHGDPNYPTTNPIGCIRADLMQWIDEDLTQTDRPWRFLFGHEPAWSYCSNLGGKGGEFCPVGSIDNQNPPYRPRPHSTTGNWAEAFGVHWNDSLSDSRCPAGSRAAYWSLLARHGVAASFSGHTHTYSGRLVEGDGTRRNDVSAYGKGGAQFTGQEGVWGIETGMTHTSAGSVYVLAHVRDNTVTFEAYDQKTTTEPFQLVETWNVVSGQAPSVAIVSPVAGATVVAGDPITVEAQASDLDGTVIQVEFYAGTSRIGLDTSSPYSVTWEGAPAGSHTLTAVATDDAGLFTTSAPVNITVVANQAPSVAIVNPVAGSTVVAGDPVTVGAQASDPDGTVARVEFYAGTSLIGVDTSSPYSVAWEGAPTGPHALTAVATDDAGLSTTSVAVDITVISPSENRPPVLSPIGGQTVAEGKPLTFTAQASDPDGNGLAYSLVGAPVGASIDPVSGIFAWTPTEAQGPGSYVLTLRVTDDGSTARSADQAVTVTVLETNLPPVLSPMPNVAVNEGTAMTASASATDPDLPANHLTYVLTQGPSGAVVNASTGAVTWTPTEAQGPGTYQLTVQVTDDGSPALSAATSFTVTVNEVNQAPALASISSKTVTVGTTLTFAASATDADLPANTLTYSLVGAPTGATIDPATGAFSWTPGVADVGSRTFSVQVADNGTPPLSSQKSVTVTVAARGGADLTLTALSTTSAIVPWGGGLSASSSVKNVGSGAAGAFATYFSLSRDGVYGGVDDVPFSASRSISSLSAGSTNTGTTTLGVPSGTPVGAYFLCAYTDGANVVSESNETNNTLCSTGTITVAAPNLRLSALSPLASTVTRGSRVKVSYSVTNDGGWNTSKWITVPFALSPDPLWSADDRVFTAVGSASPLAADGTVTATLNLTVPADTLPGLYYICGFVDAGAAVPESNESDNASCSAAQVEVR